MILTDRSDWLIRFRFLQTFVCILIAGTLTAGGRPEKPNVVLMYVDDLGWQDVKCYDIDEPSPYETPNIDALAKRGVLFWDAYSPAPTCSPSRGAILAGKHPARLLRTHVLGGKPPQAKREDRDRIIDPWHMGRLDVGETTIAEVLKANGYRTGHSGKWHIALGHHSFPQPPDHGFDVNFTGRGANSAMKPHRLTGFATRDPDDPYQLDEEGFPKDSVTLDALRFMEESKDQPFFLYYATWLVHYPIMTRSKQLLEKYCEKLGYDFPTDPAGWQEDGQTNPYYCAMVEMTDHYIGMLVKYLEATDDPRWPGHKLIENTYLIFSSDNGGTLGGGKGKFTVNTPLSGGKGSTKEGGTRVPLIMAGPGVQEGVETRVLANGVDFYPTILSWAGIDMPEGVQVDGCDLSKLLAENPKDPRLAKLPSGEIRRSMVHHFPHSAGGSSSIRRDGYKLIYHYDHIGQSEKPEMELFQLTDESGKRVDIEEKNNLVDAHPEKAQALKTDLMEQLAGMNASLPYLNPRVKEPVPNKEKVCTPVKTERDGDTVSVRFKENGAKVVKGFLFYTEDGKEWFRKEAELQSGTRLSAQIPPDAARYLFALVDEHNFLVRFPDKDSIEAGGTEQAPTSKKRRKG